MHYIQTIAMKINSTNPCRSLFSRFYYLALFLLLFYKVAFGQAQSNLQWSAWGNSSYVLDIASDAQYYYVANHFGVTRLSKSNTNDRTYLNKATTQNNMRDNHAVAVALDQNGKLLVGGNYAFHRQEGSAWQNFRAGQSGVPNFSLSDVFVDTDGSIWVAAQGTGVHKFNGSTWTSYGQGNSTVGVWVNKIFRHQNRLYFATNYNGLAWLEGTTWGSYTSTNSGLPSDSYVYDALFDASGHLWVITQAGLSKFDGTNWAHFNPTNTPIFNSTQINCLAFFQGKIYAAPAGQLLSYNGNTWTDLTNNLPIGFTGVTTMHTDQAANKLIIGTRYSDVVMHDGQTYTHIPVSNCSIRSQNIAGIAVDPLSDIKYISEDYVSTFHNQQWGNLGLGGNAPYAFTEAALKARNGKLYGGTSMGLAIYQNNTWESVSPPMGPPFFTVTGVDLGPNNQVWLSAFNEGLLRYDGQNFTQFTTSNSNIPTDNMGRFKVAPDGSIWFGVFMKKYLYKFDGTTFQKYDSINVSFNPLANTISDVAFHPNGKIYVATGGGLGEYDPVSKIWRFYNTTNSQIPSNSVNKVRINQQGDVWITTDGNDQFKIARLRNEEWLVFNDSNCPLDVEPKDFTFDAEGQVWFVAFGVFKLTDPSLPTSSAQNQTLKTPHAYPNPSSGYFTVDVEKETQFEIYDLMGRKCLTFSVIPGNKAVHSGLPAGQYFLKEAGKVGTQKLIIQ